MSQVNCFAKRLLSPFHGVMQVIAIENGEAESMDGVNWVLYVSHDDIVSHTGMSEIRYGSWNAHHGLKLSMVRGTETNDVIGRVGDSLVGALQQYSKSVPFALNDRHECWLLTEDGRPLALIDSADCETKRRVFNSPAWHPGMAAFDELDSSYGDAGSLQRLINQRAGSRSATIWVSREQTAHGYSGDAITESGEKIPALQFPARMLLEDWADTDAAALVQDYLSWQAPWLLQLDTFDDASRVTMEAQAWQRPVLCAQQYHLFSKILDEQQLKVARVKARLMGYDSEGQSVIEAFIQTGDKETYSP